MNLHIINNKNGDFTMRNLSDLKLSEALKILKEAHLVCEYADSDVDEATIKTPIYIRKLLNYKGEPLKKSFKATCAVGLTFYEQKEIENILPGFIDNFDAEYDSTGGENNAIEVDVVYKGESASWDGRDFGTYDPGWGETEITENDDSLRIKVTAAIENTIKYMSDHCDEYFSEDEATIRQKLEKIKVLLANRTNIDRVNIDA